MSPDDGAFAGSAVGEPQRSSPDPADDCPFVPLGVKGKSLILLDAMGQVIDHPARSIKLETLESITFGDMTWWNRHFSSTKWDSRSLNVPQARRWLMAACRAKGVYDDRMLVRGRGVWPDPLNPDQLLVHAGDAVLVDGDWRRPGVIRSGVLFPAAPAVERPAHVPASVSAARELELLVRCWNFDDPVAAKLLVGFVAQAMLGGWHRWRAHVFVRAQSGSGKSWLAKVVETALGGAAHPIGNNVTAAYIQQALTGEARALILDEAKRDDTGEPRILGMIELIRNMSGADGARIGRGSAEGQARGYAITGAVYMSAILRGYLEPQDRSRITTLDLGPLDEAARMPGRDEEVARRIRQLADASPALRARMIQGTDRFLENFHTWRTGFIARGSGPREADQLATLVAGYETLTSDTPSTPAYVEAQIGEFAAWIGESAEDETEGEGRECLDHLLGSLVDLTGSGERKTVAALLMEAREPSADPLRRSLQRIGLRLEIAAGPGGVHLLVANSSPGLQELFRESRWAKKTWPDALRYLDGAGPMPGKKTVYMDGSTARCTAIPARYLPVPE